MPSQSVSARTQCPSCGTQFILPPKALSNAQAKARCKKCQHIFLVNDYLVTELPIETTEPTIDQPIVAAPSSSASPLASAKTVTSSLPAATNTHAAFSAVSHKVNTDNEISDDLLNTARSDEKLSAPSSEDDGSTSRPLIHQDPVSSELSDDILIHDDMAIEDEDEDNLRYDDEELDRWINNPDLSTQLASSPTANRFDDNADTERSINADDADSQDDWLNQLLDEEGPTKDPNLSRSHTDDESEDLSKLLSDFGVESVAPAAISREEVLAKMNARLQHNQSQFSRSNSKSPLSAIVWGLGCLALALLLAAQYVIFNLDTLIKNPSHAAKLQSLCQLAHCALPSADMDQIRIAHLKHRPSQVEAASTHSDIMAAIVNNSNNEQLFPNLKVSIYGNTGLIGEFVASPEQYLTPPQRLLINDQSKLIMFTVPIKDSNIDLIDIKPFY